MKKRIAFSIALLMILCLALAGCAQRDNHAGATSDPTSESHEGGGVGTPDNSDPINTGPDNSDQVDVGNDGYTFKVGDVTISCSINVNDYINENVGIFYFTRLALDLGWHTRNPGDEEKPDIMSFYCDDANQYYVGFDSPSSGNYEEIEYWGGMVKFNRIDNKTYRVNSGGLMRVNLKQIWIMAYLLENQINNPTSDSLSNLFSKADGHYYIP